MNDDTGEKLIKDAYLNVQRRKINWQIFLKN